VPSSGSAPFTVENPTGTCEATGDGSRPGYHSPDAGDVYLPDCKLELDREYWRVFATAPDSAYTIPRTDGNPMLRLACTTPGQPESPLVEKYGLCQPASSAAAVDRVNDLLIEDAFAITRYLHSQLVFRGVDTGVAPPPLPDDVIDACALHPESSSVALQTVCEEERARMMSGNDIGISYGEVGLELAALLNELYGIAATDQEIFGPELCSLPVDPGPCDGAFIAYRYDPAGAKCVEFGWGGCGGNANRFGTLDACNESCSQRAGSCSAADCSSCPVELDSSGVSCSTAGMSCGFGGCTGGTCNCIEDGAGGLVWECLHNLC
jgi:hypothetical protein